MTHFSEEWAQQAIQRAGARRTTQPAESSIGSTPPRHGPKLSERDITRQIRDCLKYHGVFHWKVMQGLGSTPGVADILGCYKGRLLAIEVKAPGGRLSDHQKAFLDRVTKEGGIAIVAYSVDAVIGQLNLKPPLFGGSHGQTQVPQVSK